MVVYEKNIFSRALDRNSDWLLKSVLIDNHYKIIFVSVRMACSCPTVRYLCEVVIESYSSMAVQFI